MIMSATNFFLFFMLANRLGVSEFILFSAAVSISVMAYAIAEAGISYIAPLILSKSQFKRSVLNTCFIIIGLTVYIITFCTLYVLWNLLADTRAEFTWAFAYALYFLPVMFIPAWSTCWYVNIYDLFFIIFGRFALLATVFVNPTAETLNIGGTAYVIFIILYLYKVNKHSNMFKLPSFKNFKFVLVKIKDVFFAKTITYFIYSSIPLFVAAIFGGAESAIYLFGERLKSAYTTLFQPIIQTFYLMQFKDKVLKKRKSLIMPLVMVLNLISIGLIFFIMNKEKGWISEIQFNQLIEFEFFSIYILAAGASVFSSCFLFFRVLPNARYDIFQFGVYLQSCVFLLLFFIVSVFIKVNPAYILLLGELFLLLFLLFRKA